MWEYLQYRKIKDTKNLTHASSLTPSLYFFSLTPFLSLPPPSPLSPLLPPSFPLPPSPCLPPSLPPFPLDTSLSVFQSFLPETSNFLDRAFFLLLSENGREYQGMELRYSSQLSSSLSELTKITSNCFPSSFSLL